MAYEQSRRRRRSVPHRNDGSTLLVDRARFPFVAVGAVSTRRLLSAEGRHVTKATSHTGSITERFGGLGICDAGCPSDERAPRTLRSVR